MGVKIISYGDSLHSRMDVWRERDKMVSRSKEETIWVSKYYDAKWYPHNKGDLVLYSIKDYGNKEIEMLLLGDTFEEVRDEIIKQSDRLTFEEAIIVREQVGS